ncbi:IS4 family transposase [Desulfotomaculum copahuensis]|uniref:Transposase n=1 Tax=Desulfotomaculum copahuensis TaxID=1838280 RepID=A0A1B7LG52_9FIRM|nr:transposase [Desulfotomaculum copahuensis]OAT83667.1 transposase [Desulfotomaculum copahuensis]
MSSILPEKYGVENQVDNFLKCHKIGRLLRQANFNKEKGFSCLFLFRFIFSLVFTGKNLYQTLQTERMEEHPAKDAIYRFLNSSRYNWRKFLAILSSTLINNSISDLTSADRVKVLIIDDSLYSRNRSKTVELLAKVFDHVENKFVHGFRMLTLGWSDGNTFLPLAFSLLSSEKEKNRLCGMKPVDKRTNGYKRRAESTRKATEIIFELLRQIRPYHLTAQYLLFDSRFAYPSVIIKVLEHNLQTICMLKAMPKVFYGYLGEQMNLKKLYNYIYKKPGRAKILASVVVELGRDKGGRPVKAKIVFVRDRNRSKKWLALLSTDISLSEQEIIRIYGKRWDIEVFFKMSKSFLKPGKEFQGRSYDAMVAHTTIVFCRYIMLAIEKRNNEDPRTLGNLFYHYCDELQDIKFSEALFLLLDILKESLEELLFLPDRKIREFIDHFVSRLPVFFKERLQLSICES